MELRLRRVEHQGAQFDALAHRRARRGGRVGERGVRHEAGGDVLPGVGDLQQQLFRPIAEKTQEVLKAYSSENGFAVVFDSSSQSNGGIIHVDPIADITTEIIRRVDATPTKAPAAPAPAKK